MRILYTFGLRFYFLAISIAALLGKEKAKKWLKGRRNWEKELESTIPKNKKLIWFHTASLGEFEQARPLIDKVKAKQSDYFVLLTFFSPSGYEIRKGYPNADLVCYLPLDTPQNAKRFVNIVQPAIAVFVKYEFWFNFLNILNKQDVKTILVSGIFRESQHFFKAYGEWFRRQLKAFHHFFVQNEISKQLLEGIGYSNVSVAGDSRVDRVLSLVEETFEDNRFTSFCNDSKVVVFGSSWSTEHEIAVNLHQLKRKEKIIIAPHEINASKISKLKQQFKGKTILFSETDENQDLTAFEVLIIDQIGLLSKVYRYGYLAVIGGGFGSGIHNTLEAAVYGCPVFFGPNHQNFQEAMDLLSSGGAFSDDNQKGLLAKIISFLEDESKNKQASEKATTYVEAHKGASDQILQAIF